MRQRKYLGAVLALAMLLSVMPATTALAEDATSPVVTIGSVEPSDFSASVFVSTDELADLYVLVLPSSDSAPDAGAIVDHSNTVKLAETAPGSEATAPVSGLEHSTLYTAYAIGIDAAGNVSDVANSDFSTGPDLTAPEPSGWSNVFKDDEDPNDPDVRCFDAWFSEAGTITYVVQPADFEQPTKDQVAADKDAKGNAAAVSGQVNLPTAGAGVRVSFLVASLAAGKYNVFYTCQDEHGNISSVTTPVTEPAGKPDFELMGEVTFTVTDSTTDAALEGATVMIGTTTVATDSNGHATFTLSAGDYTYLAQMDGYLGAHGDLTVSLQQSAVSVALAPGAGGYLSAAFIVTGGSGSAIRGATVAVSSVTIDPPVTKTTDGSGRAEFYLVNGDYNYSVEAVGRLPQSGTITLDSENISQAITLTADPAGVALTITGHETGKLKDEIDAFIFAHSFADYSVIRSIKISNAAPHDTLNSDDFTFFSSVFHADLRSADFSGTAFDGGAIPQWGFNQFTALTSVTLPESLVSIGRGAFSVCWSLESITLPANVTSLGAQAFQDCPALKSVTMLRAAPPSAGTDPLRPFYDVAPGATVTVPDGCGETYRGFNDGLTTDRYWYGLYIIDPTMPAHLTAKEVDRTSDEAATVTFGSDEAGAYYYAFVVHTASAPTIDTSGAGTACSMGSTTINVPLTEGAKDIYIVVKDANGNPSDSLKIEIPMAPLDMVIDHQATRLLQNEIDTYLAGVDGVGKIRSLKVVGGVIDSTDDSYLQGEGGPHGWSIQTLDFSETAFENGTITEGLFANYESLVSISLPEGVTSIGGMAFAGCIALEDVTLPSDLTSIGVGAFASCEALKGITLPSGVQSIGQWAFAGCVALKDVTLLSATPPSVGEDAFSGVAADATVHVPAHSAAAYRADDEDTTDNLWFGLVIQEPSAPDGGDEHSAGPSLPQPTVETAGAVTTVTLTAATTADNNGVQASVTEAQVNAAIQMALSGTGDTGTGVISITSNGAPTVSTATTTAPGAALDAIAANGLGLTINSPVAKITFDSDAVSALADQTTADVKITAAKVDVTTLPDQARQLVGNHPVYNFSVICGGTSITQFGGDVTLSVPYTPQAGEDPDAIVIYYIDAQGVPQMVSDCVYDPETGLVTFHTNHFSEYAVGYNKVVFSDVSANAWYAKAVGFIAARNITTGTGNGNYSPDANLTRAQFLVMVMRAYGIAPDQNSGSNFADAGDTYYTGYLAAAKRLGIASGVGDNLFAPDSDITRQEMFTLLYKALKLNGRLPAGASGKTLADFSDADQIASWAEEAMKLFVTTGTISGSGGQLAPTATASRAEMAQVIYNLLAD